MELGTGEEFKTYDQVPADKYTDDNIALILIALGIASGWGLSQKKGCIAAINDQLFLHGKHTMSATNAGNAYPKSTAVIKRWLTEVKENPHHTKHAGVFSPEACRYVLGEYPLTEAVDFQHRCVFVMSVFGAMRMEDIDCTRSEDVKIEPYDAELDIPRSVCFVLRKTKNDPRGDGPVEGRTWRVPCCCLTSLDAAADSKRMKADLKENPQVPCYDPCPYQVIIDYTLRIFDPFGLS